MSYFFIIDHFQPSHLHENQLKLTDLNEDVQLLILDELDFSSLISLAETSKAYSFLVADMFKRKYLKSKALVIFNPFYPDGGTVDTPFNDTNVQITTEKIIVDHFGAVLKILQLLGHLITKLSFHCHFVWNDLSLVVSEIGRYINKYCANSLIEFDIVNYGGTFLQKMSTPFKQVESVSIAGKFNTFDSETLAFEKLFPSMRKLSLKSLDIRDGTIIDREFPNLDSLFVCMSYLGNDFRQDHIESLLIKNQQIRILSIDSGSRSILKFVGNHLPNIFTLSIENYFDYTLLDLSPIVFKNVKNFTVIAGNRRSVPDNIYFPNLVEFSAYVDSWSGDKWIDIVHCIARNASTFRKLKVWQDEKSTDSLQDEQLNRLSEQTLNLDEICLKLYKNVGDETIAAFVLMNAKTKKIRLSRVDPPNSFQNVVNMIRNQFGNKWNIIELDNEILLELLF